MPRRARLLTLLTVSLSIVGLVDLIPPADSTQAEAGTGPAERPDPTLIRLENPGLAAWRPEFPGERARFKTEPAKGFDRLALPKGFFVPIFDTFEKPRKVIGRARRGAALSARKVDTPITCYDNSARGAWYAIEGDGFVCSTSGFELVRRASPLDPPQRNPGMGTPMPFEYARVVQEGSPRLSRKPSLREWEALASIGGPKDDPSGLMIERMIGDFFVSVDAEVDVEGIPFVRTVHNELVEKQALKPRAQPNMVGERLRDGRTLPLAFVYGDDETELLCSNGKSVCGVAEKHARFVPAGLTEVNGETYVRGPRGLLVPARAVRLIEKQSRPGGVGPSDKWVHIDLTRQTLVAYEGDVPVYATLVSSGKEGHTTPSGLYRIQRKYLSKTMRAVDPKEGLYHIEDIPWTMYYYGAYAVHGAYWHDVFGEVRSHGCTNVAPADARWIYHWSDPQVPDGWQAVENVARGTAFYFTNEPEESLLSHR